MKTVRLRSKAVATEYLVLTACVIAIGCFIIFQPRASALFIPGGYEGRIKHFIEMTKENQQLDPWAFWQLRDLSSNGVITLIDRSPTASLSADTVRLSNLAATSIQFKPWNIFQSNKVTAVEGLVIVPDQAMLSQFISVPSEQILFENTTELIVQLTATSSIYIVFVRPIDTMASVNGYLHFAYRDQVFRDETTGQQWLSVTEFKL